MKITVRTCDKYDFMLPGFVYLFNKYWPQELDQPVTIIGFREPPELASFGPRFDFVSLGKDDRPWTSSLHPYYASLPDTCVMFLYEDYWLTEPIKYDTVELMMAEVNAGAAKGDLSNNTNYFQHSPYPHPNPKYDMVQADSLAMYRTSTQPCIWRKDYLAKALDPKGLDPWEFEIRNDGMVNDGELIVGLKYQSYVYANVYYKGAVDTYMVQKLSPEDRAALAALGYSKIEEGCLDYTR